MKSFQPVSSRKPDGFDHP